MIEDKQSPIRVNSIITHQNRNLLIHSFSENILYGFKLEGIDINSNTGIRFGDIMNKKLIRLSHFFTSDESKADSKIHKIFRNIKSMDLLLKNQANRQINTGNLSIDFTNPIIHGTFNNITLNNIDLKRSEKLFENLLKFNEDSHFVFLSLKTDQSKRICKIADKVGKTADFNVIELDGSNRSELLMAIKLLPHYLKYLKDINKNVIFLLDDLEELYFSLYNAYKYDSDEVMLNFIRQLYCLCSKSTNSLVSTICLSNFKGKSDILFTRQIDAFNTELQLLSTSSIDLYDGQLKKGVKDTLYGLKPGVVHTKAFNKLKMYLHLKLNKLLLDVV